MRQKSGSTPLLAGALARGGHANVVFLVIGGLLVILGVLRLLGILPRLSVSLMGRRPLSPAVEGAIALLVGAILVVVGIVR